MKQIVSVFLLLGVFFSACSSNDVQKQANAVTLHESVYPLFEKKKDRIGCCSNTLSGDTLYGRINVYITNDSTTWLRIFKPGSDTLFVGFADFGFSDPKLLVITKKTNRDSVLLFLGLLTEVVPSVVGYEKTISILQPFFDQESSRVYFDYLRNYEPVLTDALLRGEPSLEQGFPSQTSGSTKEVYYSYFGPGKWSFHYHDGRDLYFSGPLQISTSLNLMGSVKWYTRDMKTYYKCGLFGCEKGVDDGKKIVRETISVSEFKRAIKG